MYSQKNGNPQTFKNLWEHKKTKGHKQHKLSCNDRGIMSCLRCLCLFECSGVRHILLCVFALFFFVLCGLCCQFLWIVPFWLTLWYSLMFIQNPYIEEQTTQWPKEKVQKDEQRSTKHTHKTKDRVRRIPLKTGVNSCAPEG